MKKLNITPQILKTLLISFLTSLSLISMGQSYPIVAAEGGTVAVVGCTDILVTNSFVPNPSIIEWWNDHDNNPATAAIPVQTGGTAYSPTAPGHYSVTFPWYPDTSNNVESVVHTPISMTQFPTGNITNSQTSIGCSNLVPGQLTPNYMADIEYSNPVWTRNLSILSTSSFIDELWRPGFYTLTVDGPCGQEIIPHNVDFECDNNVLSTNCNDNRTYEFGGTLSSSSIFTDAVIGQTLIINGNCVLGGHMKMEQDAIILVTPGSKLTLDGAVFSSCGTWKGIVVNGGELDFIGIPSAGLPAKIYDAEVGITILNSPSKFIVQKAEFEDNGVHIAASNSDFDIQECIFNSLKDIPNNNSYASFLNDKRTSNPMFYAVGSTISYMDSVRFDQRDDNLPGTPNTTTAIELNNTTLGANARIKILDNFVNGIYAYDCDKLHIKGTKFGSEYINNYLDYVPNQPLSENGIILTNCTNTILNGITLKPQNTGIQFYLNQIYSISDPSGPPAPPDNIKSYFSGITIDMQGGGQDEAGIIIAPDVNPLSNTDPTLNTNATRLNLDIFCSRISNCKYGIVGSGRKTDWVMPTPGGSSPPGDYDPSIAFNSNSDWNIVWSENITPAPANQMKYYSASPYSNPLIKFSNANSYPVLDGTTISTNNYTTSGAVGPFVKLTSVPIADGVYCQPTWLSYKRDPVNINKINAQSVIKAYPNPFYNELTLDLSTGATIRVNKLLGKKVAEMSLSQGETMLNTTDWSTGIYFVTITTRAGTETIQVVKQ